MFCYGITNSGKTFTVIGDEENKENHGFLPRIMEYLTRIRCEIKSQQHKITSQWEEFLEISNNSEKFALFDMKIVLESFEIYNEDIMDLTVDLPRDKFGVVLVRPKLHLKEINRKIFIKGYSLIQNNSKNPHEIKKTRHKTARNRGFREFPRPSVANPAKPKPERDSFEPDEQSKPLSFQDKCAVILQIRVFRFRIRDSSPGG